MKNTPEHPLETQANGGGPYRYRIKWQGNFSLQIGWHREIIVPLWNDGLFLFQKIQWSSLNRLPVQHMEVT